jgi:transmembrane secretion effector
MPSFRVVPDHGVASPHLADWVRIARLVSMQSVGAAWLMIVPWRRRNDGGPHADSLLVAVLHVGAADVFLETFLVTSWAEHLRQHERFTRGDGDVEEHVRRHIKGEPFVEHFVGADANSAVANTDNPDESAIDADTM